MDTCQVSVNTFDRLAETYAGKYLALDTYDAYYREFCSHVTRQGASVLDVACGPGNVSAFLVRERPDLQVLGIDLAPNMVRLAQAHVPSASFLVHDCRYLADLGRVFDGIAYAFGLNYLNQKRQSSSLSRSIKFWRPTVCFTSAQCWGPRNIRDFRPQAAVTKSTCTTDQNGKSSGWYRVRAWIWCFWMKSPAPLTHQSPPSTWSWLHNALMPLSRWRPNPSFETDAALFEFRYSKIRVADERTNFHTDDRTFFNRP